MIVARLLAHNSADLNFLDAHNKTALQLAVERGHHLVVAQLLAHNPNLPLFEELEQTVLHVAVENGHDAMVEQLLAHSPSLVDVKMRESTLRCTSQLIPHDCGAIACSQSQPGRCH